jgi:hypothetical protein
VWSTPIATDACGTSALSNTTTNVVSGTSTIYTRTWTATDGCLNQSSASQSITVTAPITAGCVSCGPNKVSVCHKAGKTSNTLCIASSALAAHLARYRIADLALDTFPYTSHTTASDALWAGLPILTQIGQSFPARVAASLLNAMDLSELVTKTSEEYESKAVDLANDPLKLDQIKKKLEQNRRISPLFNGQLFARHIEAAYEEIHLRNLSGKKPDHVYVPRLV